MTSGVGTPKARRPSDRREQISANARALFAERGFHSVRMSDIAEATGITPRALYRHYANKDALLSHVLFETQGQFLEALPRFANGYDPAELPSDLHGMARASLANPDMTRLWKREARHLDPESSRILRSRLNDLAAGLARVIRNRMPELEPVDVTVRAWAVIAVLNSHGENPAGPGDTEQTAAWLSAAALAVVDHDARPLDAGTRPSGGPVPASRREQLITIAAETFRHHGFDGASVDGIAAAAGLAGPAIYRYFESKTAMLVAIVDRFGEWVSLETIRALRSVTGESGAPAALVAGYVGLATEAENLLSVTVTESHHLPADAAERLVRARGEHLQEWAHWTRAAHPERSDPATQLLAHTARVLIDDTVRTPRVLRAEGAVDAIAHAATAVLDVPTNHPLRTVGSASREG
ncbi:TetR/AcrR family transcriptional regulator [Prauserella cavernicola]|uniref:TetR/AcrR family transcriptional regulator n=1 Tax=Prauserella cavernicola TaxID=2800127 RepID=A0A934QNM9_9PSEU|nr:TetR/AcrR family transcriptional regulator [Prauserella cavernicola]MBK1783966.1 TetR/AcrR family transcriptional regulator [Prauserella cavernicola]